MPAVLLTGISLVDYAAREILSDLLQQPEGELVISTPHEEERLTVGPSSSTPASSLPADMMELLVKLQNEHPKRVPLIPVTPPSGSYLQVSQLREGRDETVDFFMGPLMKIN